MTEYNDLHDDLEKYSEAVDKSDEVIVTENVAQVLIYVSGYVAHSVMKSMSCEACRSKVAKNRHLDIECTNEAMTYLHILDRAGLKWPSQNLVTLVT